MTARSLWRGLTAGLAAVVVALPGAAAAGSPMAGPTTLLRATALSSQPAGSEVPPGEPVLARRVASANPAHARQGRMDMPLRTAAPALLARAKQASPPPAAAPSRKPQHAPRIAVLLGNDRAGLSANDGADCCIPPDTTGAIGPANYVEMVNSMIAIYDRNLAPISTQRLNLFFQGLPDASNRYCDPQVLWDQQSSRWYFSLLFCGSPTSGAQSLYFGWSQTADPSGPWCGAYQVDTGAILNDYPRLGHDDNFLSIGANMFDSTGKSLGATLWVVSKPGPGVICPATATTTPFGDPTHPLAFPNGSAAFTPVPANIAAASNRGYVVAADMPDATGPGAALMLWHLAPDAAGHPLLAADGQLAVPAYNFPVNIPQPGSTWTIDSSDTRLTQAVAVPDPSAGGALGLWTQHTIADPAGSGRTVVRWYEILPASLSLRQSGILSSPSDYLFNAAISPSSGGSDAVIIYNRASESLYPVIAAQSRQAATPLGSTDLGELPLAGSSVLTFNGTCGNPTASAPCRWGDYSAATPDPTQTGVVWGGNQLTGDSGPWQTRNFAIAGLVTAPGAPTGVSATAYDQAAQVSWAAPASAGRTPVQSYTVVPQAQWAPGDSPAPQSAITVAAPATSAAISGLTNGLTYTFTVVASNAYGPGPASQASNAITPAASPHRGPPTRIPGASPASARPGRVPAALPTAPTASHNNRVAPLPPTGARSQPGPAPTGSDEAVTYQENAAHNGNQAADSLLLPLHRRWSTDLKAAVSYPLIADGMVFVTTDSGVQGMATATLVALDQATGAIAWQVALSNQYGTAAIAYDSGRVFAVNHTGLLAAYEATTGRVLWSVQLDRQSWWSTPPTVAGGIVSLVGAGGGATLFGVDAASGLVLFRQNLVADGAPALTPGNLYLNYGNGDAQDLNPDDRSVIWTQQSGNTGPGGPTAVSYGHHIYALDPASNALPQPVSKIIDAGSGSRLGGFTASQLPAFSGSRGFFVNGSVLEARAYSCTAAACNQLLWSYNADAPIQLAPIVVNQEVVIGSTAGTLTLLNPANGSVIWSGNVGAPIAAGGGPLVGLAGGQGLLVVPAATSVVAYD